MVGWNYSRSLKTIARVSIGLFGRGLEVDDYIKALA